MKLRVARKVAKASRERRGSIHNLRHNSETRRRACARLQREVWKATTLHEDGSAGFATRRSQYDWYDVNRLTSQEFRRRYVLRGMPLDEPRPYPVGRWGCRVAHPPDGRRIRIAKAGGDWVADWQGSVRKLHLRYP